MSSVCKTCCVISLFKPCRQHVLTCHQHAVRVVHASPLVCFVCFVCAHLDMCVCAHRHARARARSRVGVWRWAQDSETEKDTNNRWRSTKRHVRSTTRLLRAPPHPQPFPTRLPRLVRRARRRQGPVLRVRLQPRRPHICIRTWQLWPKGSLGPGAQGQ